MSLVRKRDYWVINLKRRDFLKLIPRGKWIIDKAVRDRRFALKNLVFRRPVLNQRWTIRLASAGVSRLQTRKWGFTEQLPIPDQRSLN